LTSPCPTHISDKVQSPLRLGDGKFSIVPELIKAGPARILRLTDTYTIRPDKDQEWKEFQFDQCLYLRPEAVCKGNLRAYIAQQGSPILGPIKLCGDYPASLKGRVRAVIGNDDDWAIATLPLSYVVLVFDVAGQDIGIAIHRANNQPFFGFLRFRPHLFTGVMAEEGPSSHQWHFSLRSSLDPATGTKFKAGELSSYSVQYDIAPDDQLAAEGFRIR
jgi:hypothetical protein